MQLVNMKLWCFNGSCEAGDVCPLPCDSAERWVMLILNILQIIYIRNIFDITNTVIILIIF